MSESMDQGSGSFFYLHNMEKRRESAISIEVEPVPGAVLTDAAEDVLALSRRLGIGVRATFNGIRIFAWPHYTLEDMQRVYEAGLRLNTSAELETRLTAALGKGD